MKKKLAFFEKKNKERNKGESMSPESFVIYWAGMRKKRGNLSKVLSVDRSSQQIDMILQFPLRSFSRTLYGVSLSWGYGRISSIDNLCGFRYTRAGNICRLMLLTRFISVSHSSRSINQS